MMSLRDLDGMSLRHSDGMPHPVDLMIWSESGYYTIDLVNDRFVLTEKGKSEVIRCQDQ